MTRTLHVHHENYTTPDPWNEPDANLVTVCEDCHSAEHGIALDPEAILSELNEMPASVLQIRDRVMAGIEDIQRLYEQRGGITGIPTGLIDLDRMTDGLHPGEVFVIAARPSMGKTALAMNIAEYVAVDLNLPVAIFSLEMSAQQLVQRLLCSRARVNLLRVRDGFVSNRDFPALTQAASTLAESKMFIDDTAGLTINEVAKRLHYFASKQDIKVAFVDYLQLLRSPTRRGRDNRQIEIAEISAGLKALAKELNIPLVVTAQLNRNVENRTGDTKGRPRLSDLRESGAIEQDADVVTLLLREEYYAESDEEREEFRGRATLIIAKQRNGPVGDVPLMFRKEITRFETMPVEPLE